MRVEIKSKDGIWQEVMISKKNHAALQAKHGSNMRPARNQRMYGKIAISPLFPLLGSIKGSSRGFHL